MQPNESVRWTTGIDYLTATSNDKAARRDFGRLAVSLLDEEGKAGNESKPWSFHGYVGLRCGSVEYGTRYEDDCVRISGRQADLVWEAFHGLATGIPRIDVQTTVWDHEEVLPRLAQVYRWARGREGGKAARPVFELRSSTQGGGTLYCGRRQSVMFGRVYDTFAKHRHPDWQGSVRCEVEAHGRRAWNLANLLREKMATQEQRAAFVLGWFDDRVDSKKTAGMFPRLRRHASATDHAVELPSMPRVALGCQRSLEVARKQWRRTAQRLVSLGFGPELLDCLGLEVSADGILKVLDQ